MFIYMNMSVYTQPSSQMTKKQLRSLRARLNCDFTGPEVHPRHFVPSFVFFFFFSSLNWSAYVEPTFNNFMGSENPLQIILSFVPFELTRQGDRKLPSPQERARLFSLTLGISLKGFQLVCIAILRRLRDSRVQLLAIHLNAQPPTWTEKWLRTLYGRSVCSRVFAFTSLCVRPRRDSRDSRSQLFFRARTHAPLPPTS